MIRSLQNKIMEAVLKANEFEVPPSLVERQIYYMMIGYAKEDEISRYG